MQRGSALVAVAVLAVALIAAADGGPSRGEAAATAGNGSPAPRLGLLFPRSFGEPVQLVRLGARTLVPLPGRVALGSRTVERAAVSPDGRSAALAVGMAGRLRIVDLRAPARKARALPGADVGWVREIAWIGGRLLLAGEESGKRADGSCCVRIVRLAVIDAGSGAVLRLVELPASIEQTASTGRYLVVLAGAADGIGPATLLRLDPSGDLARAELPRTIAGMEFGDPDEPRPPRGRHPGLAVDPAGRTAVVIGAEEPVAEVDLDTLDVGYHELDRPSLVSRLLGALVPAADAKGMNGPTRRAAFVAPGVVALTGSDDLTTVDPATAEWSFASDPAGLTLVDTATWRSRRVDRTTDAMAVSDGLVVAHTNSAPGVLGVTVYDAAGKRLRRLFPSRLVHGVQLLGRLALVEGGLMPTPTTYLATAVVDLRTGAVLHRRAGRGRVQIVGAATLGG